MGDIELEPHEWRLKGAKRIKPFKPQPKVPLGKPIYSSPIFSILAVAFGVWAVVAFAVIPHDTARWVIFSVAFGPISLMLILMVLFDD